MDRLSNLKYLGLLLEMDIDYYQENSHIKIQKSLIGNKYNKLDNVLNNSVDESYNLIRDAGNYYLVINFGNREYLVMQPKVSTSIYSKENLILSTLTPQVKTILQFAYQLLKRVEAPDWLLYYTYLDDVVYENNNQVSFNATEERQMQNNLIQLLQAFNNKDETKLRYYLKSDLRAKQYGEMFGQKKYLRGQKDALISYLTILNDSVINHNFPITKAYYIFNKIIAKIEMQEVEISFNIWLENITLYYFMATNEQVEINNSSLAEKTKNYILEHITHKLSLKDLSRHFEYSERYLNKRFKEKYNITIKQYVLQEKIKVAKDMLLTTDFSLKYISTKLNFSTTSYFIQVFKSFTDVTPKQFRKTKHSVVE